MPDVQQAQEIQPSQSPADSAPDSIDQLARPEMSENDSIIEISGLTLRQQYALPIVAVSRSMAQAARDSGVAERTLRRWLHDPSFCEELDRLRQESYQLARKQLQAALPHCIAMLAEIASECNDPVVRLRAIRTLMTYGVKFGDVDDLQRRLSQLEESVQHANGSY